MKKILIITMFLATIILYGCDMEYVSDNEEIEIIYSNTDDQVESLPDIIINENLVYDDNDIKMYTKYAEQTKTSYNIYFYIENNSNLNLGFNAHSYAINKINTGNNIYEMDCDVASGKKANVCLEIEKNILSKLGISELKCIDILFWAYDNDKHMKEFDTGQITINTDRNDGNYDLGNYKEIYEKDGISVQFLHQEDGKVKFALLNKTNEYIDFDVENISVNDFTSSDKDYNLISISALKDCCSYFIIEPSEEFLKLNKIDNIKTIEFDIEINPFERYENNWKTDAIHVEIK